MYGAEPGFIQMRRQRGFTLLEVVTAVLILAISMTALITWATESADRTGLLREKAIANWVAHNRMVEIHLEAAWPNLGNSNGEYELAGQSWPWRMEVKETPDEMIRRIDLFIDSPNGRGQLFALSGFVPPEPLQSGGSVNFTRRAPGGESPQESEDPEDSGSDDLNPLNPLIPVTDEVGRG